MARREALISIPDTRDPIVTVDPSTGKLVQWDGTKYIDASEEAIGYTQEQKDSINQKLSDANTLITALQDAQKKLEDGLLTKADISGIQYLLDSLQKGATTIAGGLLLTNDIILSEPTTGKVTATLSGSTLEGHKALRLGIVDTNTELTALHNDGTGHLGQLHFDGDRIVVAPIGDITAAFMEFGKNVMRQTIQELLASNALDTTTTIPDTTIFHGQKVDRTFVVANDGTLVTFSVDITSYQEGDPLTGNNAPREYPRSMDKVLRVDVNGITRDACITEWAEKGIFHQNGYDDYDYIPRSKKASTFTLRMAKGLHTISFYTNFGSGAASNIIINQKYTSDYRQTSFSDRGMRIYGGANSFVDFNHDHPAGTMFAMIRGGLDVDEIKLANGGFYAGGVINTFGNMARWVGKKLVVEKISTGRYRITHNVGSDQYVIQAIPVNTDDWNAFVIKGSENTTSVEIGVMWNSGWRDGPIHFSIFAR